MAEFVCVVRTLHCVPTVYCMMYGCDSDVMMCQVQQLRHIQGPVEMHVLQIVV
jgi:hypothetical protein